MEFSDYSQVKAVNSSGLKLVLRSPLHYWEEYLNPNREKKEISQSLKIGSIVHELLLEQIATFEVAPDVDKRTKIGKAIFEAWKQTADPSKTIISVKDLKKIEGMTNAFFQHNIAPSVLFPDNAIEQRTEETLMWTHTNGLECKARLDALVIHPNGVTVVDIKTCMNASEDEFSRAMFNNRYYMQAAFYREAVYNCLPEHLQGHGKNLNYIFICIENSPPYAVVCYPLAEWCMDAGDDEWMLAMDIYSKCLKTNSWPGYETNLNYDLDFPIWAKRKLNLPLD